MSKEDLIRHAQNAAKTFAVGVAVTLVSKVVGQVDMGDRKVVLFTARK